MKSMKVNTKKKFSQNCSSPEPLSGYRLPASEKGSEMKKGGKLINPKIGFYSISDPFCFTFQNNGRRTQV
jgi:hypothetical protein